MLTRYFSKIFVQDKWNESNSAQQVVTEYAQVHQGALPASATYNYEVEIVTALSCRRNKICTIIVVMHNRMQ
jgi:hypothetical protein